MRHRLGSALRRWKVILGLYEVKDTSESALPSFSRVHTTAVSRPKHVFTVILSMIGTAFSSFFSMYSLLSGRQTCKAHPMFIH